MINLIVNSTRRFNIELDEKIYEGDNNISQFNVKLADTLKNEKISTYNCELRVYLTDEEYLSYPIDTSKDEKTVDIGLDITDETRTVKLMFVFTKDGGVVGNTNTETVTVNAIPGGSEAPTRSELEAELAEIGAASDELESVLDGTYEEEEEENNGGTEE